MGNRASILDVAVYCGLAASLSGGAAGRAAAMSKAFHALASGSSDASDLFLGLSDEEKAEMASWKTPTPVTVEGVTLDYKDAEKEVAIGLTADCRYCSPDDPECVSVGHTDMFWIREVNGKRIAFVGDLKKSSRTVEGPDTLQLAFYGFGAAGLSGCEGYIPGLWILEDARWTWGQYVEIDGFDALPIIEKLSFAMRNDGEATTGSHCRKCYGRVKCPHHCLPAVDPGSWLGPLMAGGTGITKDNALELLLKYQAVKDVVESVEKAVKAYALETGGISDGAGKIWRPIEMQGRESCSIDRLRKGLGPDAERFIARSQPFNQFRWVKEGGK